MYLAYSFYDFMKDMHVVPLVEIFVAVHRGPHKGTDIFSNIIYHTTTAYSHFKLSNIIHDIYCHAHGPWPRAGFCLVIHIYLPTHKKTIQIPSSVALTSTISLDHLVAGNNWF